MCRPGLQDGPLPTHYEPQESVIKNPLYGQQCNPERMEWLRHDNPYHRPYDDPRFPYSLTTYRLTEHHTAGGMSRWLSWLSELQPEMFCEVSPELAAERGLEEWRMGDNPHARAREIEARVLVTERMRPLQMDGTNGPSDRTAVSLVEQGTGARRCRERADSVSSATRTFRYRNRRRSPARFEPGAEAGRRRVTSGPLVADGDRAATAGERDLPQVRRQSPKRSTDSKRRKRKRGEHLIGRAKGFFTDTTLCIGCKACEVACKQWNQLPDDGFVFHRDVVRQHRASGRVDVAACRLH